MSGIALVLGPSGSASANAVACATPDRGSEVRTALASAEAGMAVAAHAWQESLCGGSIGRCRDVFVVADASIYYRDDLQRRLTATGISPRSSGAGDLIAAAVAAWGADAPLRLEGDFAYVAFDTSSKTGHAARDPVGTRPLFHCRIAGGIALASSPSSLVKARLCSDALNTDWLAELCAGAVSVGSECAYRDVVALRQGERIWFDASGKSGTDAWYVMPPFTEYGSSKLSFDEAAGELRQLIVDAVRERIDPSQPTIVTLSGGRDSTAVYAAGRHCAGDRVQSVSLSYPPGDIGRENETIVEVLAQCGGQPTWVEAPQVPILAHVGQGRRSHDAFRHPYEGTTTALSDRASALGARVVLNGLGGDTLFHAERSYLSDLLMGGRWSAFRRELREQRLRLNTRNTFRWGILPRLGRRSRELIAAARGGRPVKDVWDVDAPAWIRAESQRLAERAWSEPYRKLHRGGVAHRERRLMLEGPFAGRVVPEYTRISLGRGIEQRSPLYDLRLINFAATRPRHERQRGGDYKRLLRASMVGWLPAGVTGPRNTPLGFTGDYFRTKVAEELPQVVDSFGDKLLVEEVGLVLAKLYRAEVSRLAGTRAHVSTPALVFTALTEAWLRQKLD